MRRKILATWAFYLSLFEQSRVFAQTDPRPVALSDAVYSTSLSALTVLFVMAVVLESAFAIIFNWRIFLSYFSTKGVKTIVMVVVSLVLVYAFNLDVVASLIAAYKMPVGSGAQLDNAAFAAEVAKISGTVSHVITALVLAGGSAGIHNLMNALGFRSNREAEIKPTPPQDEAWVAVKVKRMNAVGGVQVVVSKVDTLPQGAVAPPAVAGSIGFSRPGLRELLLRNIDRFPQNGGYVVKPNDPYRILVEGKDRNGSVLTRLGDRYYVFAPRAIVDFEVEI
jgi:hypothetical protein